MAPPLYFFPKRPVAKVFRSNDGRFQKNLLKEYELGEILGDLKRSQCACCDQSTAPGPGGHSGAIVTYNPGGVVAKRVGHYPKFIRWTKVRNEPELWLGIDREYPPTPEELARPKQVPGHPVELADGNTYQVPVIRSPARQTQLPRGMGYDGNGDFTMSIRPEYEPLWDRAGECWDIFYKDGSKSTPFAELLEHSLAFLGVNYRIGRYEQSVLQLVDTINWEPLLAAALDVPFMDDLFAAKEGDDANPSEADEPSSSAPGEPAETPATAPAELNST